MDVIKIATRESALALWQAEEVARQLRLHHPELVVEIVGMTTQGDRFLNASLATIGGKGLFVKELEQSLLDKQTDIAVHSMKDVPHQLPDGLHIGAILEREDPRDAFVSNDFSQLGDLPQKAIVGTSSSRRQCQLHAHRADLDIRPLRGNVNTRLAKLDAGDYRAIILAAAGLKRLGLANRIREYIEPAVSIPAIGQGAIGIEIRSNDERTQALIDPLHHGATADCVLAERAISNALEASCELPVAGHATLDGEQLSLSALVGSPDGATLYRANAQGKRINAFDIGKQAAEQLRAQGALTLIDQLRPKQ